MDKPADSVDEFPDESAFIALLYVSYHRLMYSEIRKYIQNSWDIEDIVQSCMVKLIAKSCKLRGLNRDERVNYIIVASRNTALNFLRDSRRQNAFSYSEDIDFAENQTITNEDMLERIELLEDIKKAWEALDKRSRRILKMKYIFDKSDEEIAKEINVGANSVRMLLSRARKKMREELNKD